MPVTRRWYVYLLRCADGTLYTGVAVDVERRVREHNGAGSRGARYTRSRRPVSLVYQESAASRSAACKREYAIKRLTRREKGLLIAVPEERIKALESLQKRRRQNAASPRRAKVSQPA